MAVKYRQWKNYNEGGGGELRVPSMRYTRYIRGLRSLFTQKSQRQREGKHGKEVLVAI